MTIGLSLFRASWHSRLIAILCETGLFTVLLLAAWLIDMSPAKYTLTTITAMELMALFVCLRLHRRAADYDPIIAEFYREERKAEIAADHGAVQQSVLDGIVAAGAGEPTPDVEADADAPRKLVNEAAIDAIAAPAPVSVDVADKQA